MQLDTTVVSDSAFIVAMFEAEFSPCFVAQNYMPGEEPYTLTAMDLLNDGKVTYLVERDTARFKQDAEDCAELKFLDPTDWDGDDIELASYAPTCPGPNGYYRTVYYRTNGFICP